MTGIKLTEVVSQIVEILTPLSAEDRHRAIRASLTLLGDEPLDTKGARTEPDRDSEDVAGLPRSAQLWMKQNKISNDELQQVFHISEENAQVIASEIPGKSDKEKTLNAYVLLGIANLLGSGKPSFDDDSARTLCKSSACFDTTNHARYLKGNELTGSKDKGWTVTAPGLKRGAALVKQLNEPST